MVEHRDTVTDVRLKPAYTTNEAARYLRLPGRTLFNWSFGRPNTRPLIHVADSERHLLSFINLTELHVLDALRRIHKVQLSKIRRTIHYLGREFETEHPLVHKDMWTDGLNVFIEHYGNLTNASQEGQLAMRQIVGAHLNRIERDIRGVIRLFPLTRKRSMVDLAQVAIDGAPKVIAIDPEIAFGRPIIRGSRIPTVEIAERFKAGESVTDLANDFRRPVDEIEEAVRIEFDLDAA